MKYEKVNKEIVLNEFHKLQTSAWECGCWRDGVPIDFMAKKINPDRKNVILQAFKEVLKEKFNIEVEE